MANGRCQPQLRRLLLLEVVNTDALYRLAYVQYRRRKLVPARTNFAAVVKLAPPAHNSRYFLARISLLENKPKEAIQWLEPVVASNGSSFDATSQLAKAYASIGEVRKAIGPLNAAISQTPWDGSLYYRLGQLYQKAGEHELARDAFQTSTRLKSATAEDVEIMLRTSQLLVSGKPVEAIDLSSQILKRKVVEPGSLVALGVVFGSANLPSEAVKAFERAAMLDGSLFQAQFNYGLALLKLNRACRRDCAAAACFRIVAAIAGGRDHIRLGGCNESALRGSSGAARSGLEARSVQYEGRSAGRDGVSPHRSSSQSYRCPP